MNTNKKLHLSLCSFFYILLVCFCISTQLHAQSATQQQGEKSKWTEVIDRLKNATVQEFSYDMNATENQSSLKKNDDNDFYANFSLLKMDKNRVILIKTFSEKPHFFAFETKKIPFSWLPVIAVNNYAIPWSIYTTEPNENVNCYVLAPNKEKIKFKIKKIDLPVIWMDEFSEMSFKEKLIVLALSSRFKFANLLDFDKALNRDSLHTGNISTFGDKVGKFDKGMLFPQNKNGGYSMDRTRYFDEIIASDIKTKEKAIEIAKEYGAKLGDALKDLTPEIYKCGPELPKKCLSLTTPYEEAYTLTASENTISLCRNNDNESIIFSIEIKVYYSIDKESYKIVIKIL